ncbi:HK97 family phage prohead protease, partial [Candidatus Pacearchaeota archaeon]|nr:HK97 family phage prohead protease [Candidatus Pacearchaeota archaeon]
MKTGKDALAEFNTKDIRRVTAFVGDNAKNIDVENKRINFVVSAEVVDLADEIVEANAVYEAIHRKGEFRENPICLQCHQHQIGDGSPPGIGFWEVGTARKRKDHVEMVLRFDTDYDLGEKYWTVYRNRTMRAVSISFRIIEYHEERRGNKRVFVITKMMLHEISCVAVGCNPAALSTLKGLGIVEDGSGRSGKRKRNFVESKTVCKRLENDADYFVKQLEKWDDTPPELRCDAFSDEEAEYFTKLDDDAEAFADALSGENGAGIYNPI